MCTPTLEITNINLLINNLYSLRHNITYLPAVGVLLSWVSIQACSKPGSGHYQVIREKLLFILASHAP